MFFNILNIFLKFFNILYVLFLLFHLCLFFFSFYACGNIFCWPEVKYKFIFICKTEIFNGANVPWGANIFLFHFNELMKMKKFIQLLVSFQWSRYSPLLFEIFCFSIIHPKKNLIKMWSSQNFHTLLCT